MSDTTRSSLAPAARVGALVQRLRAAYARVQARLGAEDSGADKLQAPLQTLILAEAAMRYAAPAGAWPLHVAVIGPTQTGKSTLVNVLIGEASAEVSPLAGFTVHPHGFWQAPEGADEGWREALFPGWQRRTPAEFSRDDLAAYAVTAVADGVALAPDDSHGAVVWDTPDFDSLAARTYARGVLETAALADVLVLVLSKEKYADLSVWHLLSLLAPLGTPLLICLNKCTPDSQTVVLEALRQRVEDKLDGPAPPIVTMPHDPDLLAGRATERVDALRAIVRDQLARLDLRRGVERERGVRRLVAAHWGAWLSPVRSEHAALDTWRKLVRAAADEFMKAYDRDYLNHPERYDSFRRAAIELLNLLEIPRVGYAVAQARQWLTWPARQVWAAGRTWWEARQRRGDQLHSLGMEATVLVDAARGLLTGLQREVARRCVPGSHEYAVWQALQRRLEAEEPQLRELIEEAIRGHHARVTAEIEQTARELYKTLQKQPARLNALRGARATMDVGSILLAVKSGGLTPVDAVWASASFALTSLLMEGATGVEMVRANGELKARQRAAVEQHFVQTVLVGALREVAGRLEDAALFNITAEEVAEGAAALAAWEVGDE